MENIRELDALNVEQWRELLDRYLINSKEAAKALNVSVPRIFQLEKSGYLNSIVRGKYLKSEVETVGSSISLRRNKYRREHDVLTEKDIFKLFNEIYEETKKPVSPKILVERANNLEGCEQVIVKYRVTNVLRNLVSKNKIMKFQYGLYIPYDNTYQNRPSSN